MYIGHVFKLILCISEWKITCILIGRLATSNLKWKVFVRAKSEGPVLARDTGERSNALSLNGGEAKEVCETITQDFGADHFIINRKQVDPELHLEATSPKWRFNYKAMVHARNNKVGPLTALLRKGFSVDAKDDHGWTLSIVPAWAGSLR